MTIRRGLLSDYFNGVAVKRLRTVEIDALRSNQREFNSSNQLKKMLGTPDRVRYTARFLWLGGEQDALAEDGFLTWYESRKPPRREHRLYFPSNAVCAAASEGDTLFIARRTNDTLLAIIVPGDSTIQNQLLWLFGLDEQPALRFESMDIGAEAAELDFAARCILDELGIEIEETEVDLLDEILSKLKGQFPTTAAFSELARHSLPDVNPLDGADAALMAWLEREEAMFRRLERTIVGERLKSGFLSGDEADIDGFIAFSLGVQNRRKSRAGFSLENHLATIFKARALQFHHGATTEGKARPDFLFPGAAAYRDAAFPAERLTLLGSKSTCKDRWRQVLSEGARVAQKHLITLEPSISESQTDEMKMHGLQLILPKSLHATYKPAQRAWLMDLAAFIEMVERRQ